VVFVDAGRRDELLRRQANSASKSSASIVTIDSWFGKADAYAHYGSAQYYILRCIVV
jgi:hypothetical protein